MTTVWLSRIKRGKAQVYCADCGYVAVELADPLLAPAFDLRAEECPQCPPAQAAVAPWALVAQHTELDNLYRDLGGEG